MEKQDGRSKRLSNAGSLGPVALVLRTEMPSIQALSLRHPQFSLES